MRPGYLSQRQRLKERERERDGACMHERESERARERERELLEQWRVRGEEERCQISESGYNNVISLDTLIYP